MASSMTRTKINVTISKKLFINSLLLLIVYEKCSAKSVLRKCCSSGSVLSLNSSIYSCEVLDLSNNIKYDEFFDTRPDTSVENGIPLCKNDARLISLSASDVAPVNYPSDSCIDVLHDFDKTLKDNEPVVLHCSDDSISNIDRSELKILKIRRCCPPGEIFMSSYRACMALHDPSKDVSSINLVMSHIGYGSVDFIHVLRGSPKCKTAIVDYQVNLTDVKLVQDRIQVTMSESNDVVDLTATNDSCIDVGDANGAVVVRSCKSADYCLVNTCVRKCCPEDEAMVNTTCQKLPPHLTLSKWHNEVWNIPRRLGNSSNEIINTTDYGLLVGKPCLYSMYAVLPDENWHMTSNGMVHVPGYKTYQHHEHCNDMYYDTDTGPDGFYPFVCFDPPPGETRFTVNATLVIVSCAFLLTTLCVYICLPSLQNLHGKTLMSHVGSLLMAYVSLALVSIASPPLESEYSDTLTFCTFLGYSMLFFFLSTFFWLNVMCFDIWWKFGSLSHSGRTNTKRRDDFKRFIIYSIYAWGLAMLFVIGSVVVDSLESLPNYIKPDMGSARCWFQIGKNRYGQMIFFTVPVSIQLLVNLVFFILTARRCSMVKADIQKRVMVNRTDSRSRRFEADKSKFILNGKLFVVMGVTWLLEIISYVLNHYDKDLQWKVEFFYVSDVVNCLQGLLIFVLFVFKKKVFQALRRKFGKGGKRRESTGTGGVLDPYRVRKSPSSSTILSTFAVNSSP